MCVNLLMLAVVLAVTFLPQLALWLPTHAGLLKPG